MVKTLLLSASAVEQATTINTQTFWKLAGYLFSQTVETSQDIKFRTAGTLSNLFVRVTNSITLSSSVTTRKNGAAGNQTVSFTSTGTYEDTTHTDTVASTDLFCAAHSSVGDTGAFTAISVVFDATTNSVTPMVNGNTITSLSAASTNYFLPPCGRIYAGTTESNSKYRIRKAVTAKNMGIYLSSNSRTTNTIWTSRKNGADGGLTVTYASGETGWKEDTTHSDSLAAGDDYNVKIANGTGTQTYNYKTQKIEFESSNGDSLQHASATPTAIADNTTLFYPWNGDIANTATENNVRTTARIACTANNLILLVTANTINASSTVTSRKNGAAGSQTTTVTTNATGLFNDTSNSDTLATTDDFNIQYAAASVSGSQTTTISWMGMNLNVTTTTPVNQTWTHIYKIVGRAAKTWTHKYKIVGRATRTLTHKYKIRKLATQTYIHKYKIRKIVNTTFTHKYKIIGRANRTFTHKYKIIGRATTTYTHKYKIRLLVTKTYTHKYKIIGRTNRTFTHLYKIIGRAARTFTHKYKIRSLATQTFTHKYKIRKLATQTYTHLYKIKLLVSSTYTHKYKIIGRATRSFTHKYKLRALVNQTFTHKYKIIGRATRTFIHIYKIVGRANRTFSHKYRISVLVAKTFTHKYKIIGRATRTFTHIYKIANATSVARTFTHRYKIIAHVNQTFTHKYKIKALVTRIFTHKYKIVGRAARVYTHIYKIVGRANRIYTHKYKIKLLVNVTKTHRYKIRQLTARTFTFRYKIVGRIARTFTHRYAIKILTSRTFTHRYAIHGPPVSIVFTHRYKIMGRVSHTWTHIYKIIEIRGKIDYGIQVNIAKAESSGLKPRALQKQNENQSIDEDTRRTRKNSETRLFTRRVSSAARSRKKIG